MTIIHPLQLLHAKCVCLPVPNLTISLSHTKQCVAPCSKNTWLCAPSEWILLLFHTLREIYVLSTLSLCALFMNAFSSLDSKWGKCLPDSAPLLCRLDNVNNLGKCANLFSVLILSSFDMDTRFVPFNGGASILMQAKWILKKHIRRELSRWIESESIASSVRWKCELNAPFRMHINVRSVLWFSWMQLEPKQKASHH